MVRASVGRPGPVRVGLILAWLEALWISVFQEVNSSGLVCFTIGTF